MSGRERRKKLKSFDMDGCEKDSTEESCLRGILVFDTLCHQGIMQQ